MKVRFWGTRGSIPKPGHATLRYGGNTSCVELCSAAGTRIVLDCGSGAQDLGQALMAGGETRVCGHILITHTHWDHIQGLPFFAPMFVPGNEWDIYGPHAFRHSLRDLLAGQMRYTYFPIALQHLGATVRYHDLVEGEFRVGEITVRAQYLNHPALTLGYRLEADGVTVVYACDHEPYAKQQAVGEGELSGQDRSHAEFLAGADLVIHDAQYTAEEYETKVGWGHSPMEYAIDMCRRAGARRLVLTHHDPLRSDDALDRIIGEVRANPDLGPLEVYGAAEGQDFALSPCDRRPAAVRSEPLPATPPPVSAMREQSLLVMAEDPALASSIGNALRTDEVRLLEVKDQSAVLTSLQDEPASLVVLEHRPPDQDALAICRAIRALAGPSAKVPVVLVADGPDEADCAEAEVTEWLVRPFSEVYLQTKLHAWLMRTACRWVKAPLPPNEERRLRALRDLGLLDTPPEERFDRITRLAAAVFEVPITLVSLVDGDRQWYKSCRGTSADGSSRDASFCGHAILQEEVLMVPDTLQDERFADNPFVTGEPRIRFYAGHPLTLQDGSRVGTLCLVDTRPRWLDATQIALLHDLGRLVEQELQMSLRPGPTPVAVSA